MKITVLYKNNMAARRYICLCQISPEQYVYHLHTDETPCKGVKSLQVRYSEPFWKRLNTTLIPYNNGFLCDIDNLLGCGTDTAMSQLGREFPDYRKDIAFGGQELQVWLMPTAGGFEIHYISENATDKIASNGGTLVEKIVVALTVYTAELISKGVIRLRKPFDLLAISDKLLGSKSQLVLEDCSDISGSAYIMKPTPPSTGKIYTIMRLIGASCYDERGYYLTSKVVHPQMLGEFYSTALYDCYNKFVMRVIKVGGKLYCLEQLAACIPEKIQVYNSGDILVYNTQHVIGDANIPGDTAQPVATLPVCSDNPPLNSAKTLVATIDSYCNSLQNLQSILPSDSSSFPQKLAKLLLKIATDIRH